MQAAGAGCCVRAAGSQISAVAVPAESPAPGADICPCPMAWCLLGCGLRELSAHLSVQLPSEQDQRAQLCEE